MYSLSEENKYIWLAGVIEGEGCLGLYQRFTSLRKPKCWEQRLTIVNTSKELIDFLKNEFGGNYYLRKKSFGLNVLPIYEWTITGDKLKPILEKIFSYSVSKNKTIELLLESYKLQKEDTLFYKLAWEIKELKVSNKGRKKQLTGGNLT